VKVFCDDSGFFEPMLIMVPPAINAEIKEIITTLIAVKILKE